MTRLRVVTLRVAELPEAFRFYTEKLGFKKRTEMPYGEDSRWLTVAPPRDSFVEIILQPAEWFKGNERSRHLELVGKNPTLVFDADDCRDVFEDLKGRGVEFTLEPTDRGYGIEADAKDLYGNTPVFVQRK